MRALRPGLARRLGRRYRTIFAHAGMIWMLAAALLPIPLVILVAYPEEAHLWSAFLAPAVALGALGAVGRLGRPRDVEAETALTLSEGAAVVVIAWLGAIVAATWVFVLTLDLTLTSEQGLERLRTRSIGPISGRAGSASSFVARRRGASPPFCFSTSLRSSWARA